MFWMRSTTNQKRQEQRRHVHNPMNSCWNVSSVEYFLTSLPGVMHEHLSLFCSRRSAALLSELKINHEFVSLYHLWTSECDSSSQNMTLLSITLLRSSVHNIFFFACHVRSSILSVEMSFLTPDLVCSESEKVTQSRSHSRVCIMTDIQLCQNQWRMSNPPWCEYVKVWMRFESFTREDD